MIVTWHTQNAVLHLAQFNHFLINQFRHTTNFGSHYPSIRRKQSNCFRDLSEAKEHIRVPDTTLSDGRALNLPQLLRADPVPSDLWSSVRDAWQRGHPRAMEERPVPPCVCGCGTGASGVAAVLVQALAVVGFDRFFFSFSTRDRVRVTIFLKK